MYIVQFLLRQKHLLQQQNQYYYYHQHTIISFLLFNSIFTTHQHYCQQSTISLTTVFACSTLESNSIKTLHRPYDTSTIYNNLPFVSSFSKLKRQQSSSNSFIKSLSTFATTRGGQQEQEIINIMTTKNKSSSSSLYDRTVAYNEYASVAVEMSDSYIRNGWLHITRSVRDIDNNKRRKYLYTIPYPTISTPTTTTETTITTATTTQSQSLPQLPPLPPLPPQELNDASVQIRIPSPSGNVVVIIRNEKDHNPSTTGKYQQTIEIWRLIKNTGSFSLRRRIPLDTMEHGTIISNNGGSAYGTIPSFNTDETCLLYTAERIRSTSTKPKSFFDLTNINTNDKSTDTTTGASTTIAGTLIGKQHTIGIGIDEKWGEKLYNQSPLLDIYIVNIQTGKVGKVLNVPGGSTGTSSSSDGTNDGYTFGQVSFQPTTKLSSEAVAAVPVPERIVYTGWDAGGGTDMPRRLGRIYCSQRSSKIYISTVQKLIESLSKKVVSSSSSVDTAVMKDNTDKTTENNINNISDEPYITVTNDYRISTSAIFSSDNTKLFYLSTNNKEGFDTHSGCYALHSIDINVSNGTSNSNSHRIVVPQITCPMTNNNSALYDFNNNEEKTAASSSSSSSPSSTTMVGKLSFPGLFLSELTSASFIPQSEYMLVTTQWGSVQRIVRINTNTGKIRLVRLVESISTIHNDDNNNNHDSNDICDTYGEELLCVSPNDGSIVVTVKSLTMPSTRLYRISREGLISGNIKGYVTELTTTMGPISSSRFSPLPDVDNDNDDENISNMWWFNKLVQQDSVPSSPSSQSFGTIELISIDPPTIDGVTFNEPIQSLLVTPNIINSGHDTSVKPKLIVVLHGGPHSVSNSMYIPGYAYLCGYGQYALLFVNYRGSTGFGQGSIDSLPTNIGTVDVADIVATTKYVLGLNRFDANHVGLCGGSHGGFLTAHLSGQYPNLFHASVLRNPVINLPSMVTATDIPDWVHVEGGICTGASTGSTRQQYDWTTYKPPTSNELQSFYEKSPIRYIHNVTIPSLIMIGMKDLRVPPSQGLEWYYSLKSKGIITKFLCYNDDDHALDTVHTEADHWINIVQWFDEHL